MKIKIQVFIVFVIAFSSGLGQPGQPRGVLHRFEVSGGTNLLMPRHDYNSGWGLGLDGVLNLSPRYGLNLAYGITSLDAKIGDTSKLITTVTASLELAFRRERYVQSFTSFGMGTATGEDDLLFIFGAGIKIPFMERFLVRLGIRDYHSEFGIPFMEFPGGRVAFQGFGGSRYLELGIGIAYTFGEKKETQRRRPNRL